MPRLKGITPERDASRDELILRRLGEYQTPASIAHDLGVSRQRVHQVIQRLIKEGRYGNRLARE